MTYNFLAILIVYLGHDIAAVEKAASHVFSVSRIALDHLVLRFETGVGDLSYRELLMASTIGGDYRRVGREWKVNAWIRHQVCLELVKIDIERTVESQRSSDGGDNLANHAIQVVVGRTLDAEVVAADVINRLVIDHEGAIRVLQGCVSCQDRIVGLNHGSRNLIEKLFT